MWERRAELEGFASAMEAVRNAVPGLKNAIADRDYDQIRAGRTKQAARQEFLHGLDIRLTEVPFVAGDEFRPPILRPSHRRLCDRGSRLPITGEHAALKPGIMRFRHAPAWRRSRPPGNPQPPRRLSLSRVLLEAFMARPNRSAKRLPHDEGYREHRANAADQAMKTIRRRQRRLSVRAYIRSGRRLVPIP